MLAWILSLLVSAVVLIIVSKVVRGFEVDGFGPAILAALVIGIVNAVLGPIFRFLAFPITFLTLGLFQWVISAILLLIASAIVPGFKIRGFWPALLGALLIALANVLLGYLGL
jgi:putative membrane protein